MSIRRPPVGSGLVTLAPQRNAPPPASGWSWVELAGDAVCAAFRIVGSLGWSLQPRRSLKVGFVFLVAPAEAATAGGRAGRRR